APAQNAAPAPRAPASIPALPTATISASFSAPQPAAPAPAAALPLAERADGPHELTLAPGRAVFYAMPRERALAAAGARPWRVIGHLHGICYPPSYSAGRWLGAAIDAGVLVAPTGNAHCGDANVGPPSWEAPSWEELVTTMDADLERSIAKVQAKHPGSIRRDGAVLTGFSRGAYAAPVIARMHPKRWPLLVLIEANVPLSAASLRKSGVRAVALLAGEVGTEIAGERKTEAELTQAGFPAKLFVMPRVGHVYPDEMDAIMAEALAFVMEHEHDGDAGSDAGSPP
ncbi:MAG: hypothetical protein JWP87_1483, partial [Labilithrix sp.]|nr:hypothetical protein [Labilithrix sp.]